MADGMHHDNGTGAPALLRELAAAHGVGTSYWGWDGVERSVADSTLRGVLAALGVPAGDPDEMDRSLAEARLAPWRRLLPPVVVAREGQELPVNVHVPHGSAVSVWIVTEDGHRYEATQRDNWDAPVDVDGVLTGRATFAVPDRVPLGWHTLLADNDGTVAQCPLIVTPREAPHDRGARRAAELGSDRAALFRAVLPVLGHRRLRRPRRSRRHDGAGGRRFPAGQPAARRRAPATGRGLALPAHDTALLQPALPPGGGDPRIRLPGPGRPGRGGAAGRSAARREPLHRAAGPELQLRGQTGCPGAAVRRPARPRPHARVR